MGILHLPSPRGRLLFHEFDPNYVQRLREGDPETERHFIAYFAPLLLIKLRTKIRSAVLIEDIRQETFLRTIRAVRSSNEIRQPERLGAFVHTVCKNVMMEYLRSSTRQSQLPEDAPEPADHTESIEGELISRERKRMVREVVDELPDKDRRLLRSVFLEERDKDEVCREFRVDRDYLSVLLHRAKQSFRTRYLENEAASQQRVATKRD